MDTFRNCLKYAIATLCAAAASPAAWALSSVEHQEAMRRADAEFRTADAHCGTLPASQKSMCRAEAEATRKRAKAEADAAYRTADAKRDARMEAAGADRVLAKAQCEALSGEAKDECLRKARAQEDAQVAAAQKVAGDEKLDADFRMAMKRCEALAGGERVSCTADAQAKYGRK